MRAFLSVHLNEALHRSIEELQRRLTPSVEGIRWTRPQNCHLTLKFFGEIEEKTAEHIHQCLLPVIADQKPFPLELGTIGQFPPRGALSVLWVGVTQGSEKLMQLEEEIHTALKVANISYDKKRFKPHLTIGRSKQKVYLPYKTIDQYKSHRLGKIKVDALYLMESELRPKGPIYTERARFPLG